MMNRMVIRTALVFGLLCGLSACGGDDSTQTTQASPPSPAFQWPADHAVSDANRYAAFQDGAAMASATYRAGPNGGPGDADAVMPTASLELKSVDETPATKHNVAMINGNAVQYTASAGHLIAWAPANPKDSGTRDPQASIFYMAYTRDDLPHNQRPVTFLFNGGPGEPSIWMHLGAWAPKRINIDAPNLPSGNDVPDNFELVDNSETLLDQTDLVFVDVIGSGYSEAISPHENNDFWSIDSDAEILRDFITSYINKNNRQSSPKYLIGESYSGIRTPIVAKLLAQAGTANYLPDPTGKPPVVLSGVILQSPCFGDSSDLRVAVLPTLGMVVDYYGKSSLRNGRQESVYASYLGYVSLNQYLPSLLSGTFSPTTTNLLSEITGLNSEEDADTWDNLNDYFVSITSSIYPDSSDAVIDAYDGRVSREHASPEFDLGFYEDPSFYGKIKPYLSDEFGYSNSNADQIYGSNSAGAHWSGWDTHPTSIPDLVEVLEMVPDMKVLAMHGYDDSVCPFFRTEMALSSVGLWPNGDPRVNVEVFDGGHMTYLTNSSRVKMRETLRSFF